MLVWEIGKKVIQQPQNETNSPRSGSAKAISRLAYHTNRRQMNMLDVIVTADCLESRGIPNSLIHVNKQPDYHRVGRAPVTKASSGSA